MVRQDDRKGNEEKEDRSNSIPIKKRMEGMRREEKRKVQVVQDIKQKSKMVGKREGNVSGGRV